MSSKLVRMYRHTNGIWRGEIDRDGKLYWFSLDTRNEAVARRKWESYYPMNEQIRNAYRKVINKHHAFVQTDTLLGQADDDKSFRLEKLAKQFREEYLSAEKELMVLLEAVTGTE